MQIINSEEDIYMQYIDEEFNLNNLDKYIKRFEYLKKKLQIREECNFFGEEWIYKVGGVEKTIVFPIEFLIKKVAKEYGKSSEYIDVGFRYFILEKMLEMGTAINLCSQIKLMLRNGIDYYIKLSKNELSLAYYKSIVEFFEFLHLGNIDEVAYLMDRVRLKEFERNHNNYKSKDIVDFDDIFAFSEIIDAFFSNATTDELKIYYPLVLWWKITTIIPLRPSEFVATDFDCLQCDEENYYLTVKRSNPKSRYEVINISNMEDYYRTETITINKSLYDTIQQYKQFITKNFLKIEPKLLIPACVVLTKHQKYCRNINEDIFTSQDLYVRLNHFYKNVVVKKMGIGVLGIDYDSLKKIETVEKLTPYDTRHIAIINLILMGNEPQVVMKLADHELINTTYGYYDHIEQYVKSLSIHYARKETISDAERLMIECAGKSSHRSDWEFVNKEDESHKEIGFKVDGGICRYIDLPNDMSPCFKVEGNHSMCEYFAKNEDETKQKQIEEINNKINNRIKVIKDLVTNCSKELNYKERNMIKTEKLRNDIALLCKLSKSMNLQ